MTWVTCKLRQGKTRVINLAWVKDMEKRGDVTMIRFIDGESMAVEGDLTQAFANDPALLAYTQQEVVNNGA